jgi:tetratricopeptide (TPR) repeat protein
MRFVVFVGICLVSPLALAQFHLSPGDEDVNQASELIASGDYVSSEPLLERALRETPDSPYAHANLAAVLRATGSPAAALVEYRQAQLLFERTGGGANGEADIANCLFGIALTEEANGDSQTSARGWRDYLQFASKFQREQPAVAIARSHLQTDDQMAHLRAPSYNLMKANRNSTTR